MSDPTDRPEPTHAMPSGGPSGYGPGYPAAVPVTSGPSVGGHLVSMLLALVLPPIALAAFDWGMTRYWIDLQRLGTDGLGSPWPYLAVAGGAFLLLVVAAAGRLAWSGPALAAVVYGVVPWLAIVLAREEVFRLTSRLDDVLWTAAAQSIVAYGFLLFPTMAALLFGTAIAAGRRRT